MPPSTLVTTSATTDALPRSGPNVSGFEVVYEPSSRGEPVYVIEPHPPTPRGESADPPV